MAVQNSAVASTRSRIGSSEARGSVEQLRTEHVERDQSIESPAEPRHESNPPRRQELHACIAWLLESESGDRVPVEKRAHRRYSFRKPLTVTPVNNHSGRPDPLKCFPAFGIDISASGICFLARQLVPARKAVLSLEGPCNKTVPVLFEPRWVRFTRGGWYQTGGRLLEVLQDEKDIMPAVRLLDPPPELDELCEKSRHS